MQDSKIKVRGEHALELTGSWGWVTRMFIRFLQLIQQKQTGVASILWITHLRLANNQSVFLLLKSNKYKIQDRQMQMIARFIVFDSAPSRYYFAGEF